MNWNSISLNTKLNILAGETTVDFYLLRECDKLIDAIANGASHEECMEIVNNNF